MVRTSWDDRRKAEDMVGKIVTHIDIGEDSLQITCDDGTEYLFMHEQDCCEWVRIVDTVGDLRSLVGHELIAVDQKESQELPREVGIDMDQPFDSWTITDLVFKTTDNTVISRWIGESNGYYSENVDLYEITKKVE